MALNMRRRGRYLFPLIVLLPLILQLVWPADAIVMAPRDGAVLAPSRARSAALRSGRGTSEGPAAARGAHSFPDAGEWRRPPAPQVLVPHASPPTIDVWYGTRQYFGQNGIPQRWINIVGNVSDEDGFNSLKSLTYTVNGGAERTLNIGADGFRLVEAGDFNADPPHTDFHDGENQVVLIAKDKEDNTSTETVIVEYEAGNTWPDSYSINWSTVSDIQQVAQVVDGLWEIRDGQLHTARPGYDRLVAIGDMAWTDYEVVVPITIHEFFTGRPGVGILARWNGHGEDNDQPHYEHPFGGLGWYRYYLWDQAWLAIMGNSGENIDEDLDRRLELEVTYIFKMRVITEPGGDSRYSLKVWPASEPEPDTWDLSGLGDGIDPDEAHGSAVLVAHRVDASFGDVTIRPLQGGHVLTVTTNGEGWVQHTPGNPYTSGDLATLRPVPATHWSFTGWSGPDAGDLTDNHDGTWSLIMNGDKAVTANFEQTEFIVSVGIDGQGAVAQTPGNPHPSGEVVILTPSPTAGWRFVGWSGPNAGDLGDLGDGTWSLTVNEDKEVTATFAEIALNVTVGVNGKGSVEHTPGNPYQPGEEALLRPVPDPRWSFDGWNGPNAGELKDNRDGTWSLVVDEDKSVTAEFIQTEFRVVVSVGGEGSVEHTPGNPYGFGEVATLRPVPDQGWAFDGWSGPDAGELEDSGGGTWSLVVNEDKSVKAEFIQSEFNVTVSTDGEGSVEHTPGNPYTSGEVATLRPLPDQGWDFVGWAGTDAGQLRANPDGTWSLTVNEDKSVTARFRAIDYTVEVGIEGEGEVQHTPGNPYQAGQVATLLPVPEPGWTFEAWSGPNAGELEEQPQGTWLLVVDSDKRVTATFDEAHFILEITVEPEGQGSVEKQPDQSSYLYGDEVVLSPQPPVGWDFSGWRGIHAGDLEEKPNGTWSLTMDGDKELTASFTSGQYTLTVTPTPEGVGTVDWSPDRTTYSHGDLVTLVPSPDPGWVFAHWSGPDGAEPQDNLDGTWSLTMTGDKEVIANFEEALYNVTVETEGQGTVRHTPGNPYYYLELAVLEPLPEEGWHFFGWSGPNAIDLQGPLEGAWQVRVDGEKQLTATFVEYQLFVPLITRKR